MTADVPWVVLVLFAASLLRAIFGFGDALLAMPLLTILIGVSTAAPLVGLLSLLVAVGILLSSRRHVDIGAARRLLLGNLVGAPVGVLILTSVDEHALRVMLGALVVGFGLYRLVGPRLGDIRNPRWALPFGFASGCLGAAYNIGGPPVVLYGTMRRWDPDRFRATLQAYFLASSVVVASAHALAGLWTRDVWTLFAVSAPGVAAALWAGRLLARRLQPARFEAYLSVLLIVLGAVLVL